MTYLWKAVIDRENDPAFTASNIILTRGHRNDACEPLGIPEPCHVRKTTEKKCEVHPASLSLLVERVNGLSCWWVDDSDHRDEVAVCQHQRVPAPKAPQLQRGLLSCGGFVGVAG